MNILSPLRWDKIEISNSFSVRRSIRAIEIGPNEVLVFGSCVTRNTMIFDPRILQNIKKDDKEDRSYILNFVGDKVCCKEATNLAKNGTFWHTHLHYLMEYAFMVLVL